MAEADDDTAAGRHAADPQPYSWWTHLKALGTVVVALAFVVAVPASWTTDRAAARNEGVPGLFRATQEDVCGRGGCSYLVDFTSDDGTVVLHDHDAIDVGDSVGDHGPAQYFPDEDEIYAVDSRNWAWGVAGLLGAAAWIVGYAVWLGRDVRLRRRLRHPRAARARDAGRPE